MEFEVSYSLENEQQFWDELEEIVSSQCQSHELIDSALQSYLSFVASYQAEYLKSDYDIARCCYMLLGSSIFTSNKDYVRYQILHTFLQEEELDSLWVLASFLLFDGRQDEELLRLLDDENGFSRLVELLRSDAAQEPRLAKILLDLLYEMARIQRIDTEQLSVVDDNFILNLLNQVEHGSDDSSDPYNTPTIRVLLVLSEQYMVRAVNSAADSDAGSLTNKVLKIISFNGHKYRVFGENIIYLLNREAETSMQLLILKILYLFCTTDATYEYFYTNDLHVLVDVILRNLLDLPSDSEALRHTYLRVLYPLLRNTQLNQPPHYKAPDITRILSMLSNTKSQHFQPVDSTTLRLVTRCLAVDWLEADSALQQLSRRSTDLEMALAGGYGNGNGNINGGIMSNEQANGSALSVSVVAEVKAKPGVYTQSRVDNAVVTENVESSC